MSFKTNAYLVDESMDSMSDDGDDGDDNCLHTIEEADVLDTETTPSQNAFYNYLKGKSDDGSTRLNYFAPGYKTITEPYDGRKLYFALGRQYKSELTVYRLLYQAEPFEASLDHVDTWQVDSFNIKPSQRPNSALVRMGLRPGYIDWRKTFVPPEKPKDPRLEERKLDRFMYFEINVSDISTLYKLAHQVGADLRKVSRIQKLFGVKEHKRSKAQKSTESVTWIIDPHLKKYETTSSLYKRFTGGADAADGVNPYLVCPELETGASGRRQRATRGARRARGGHELEVMSDSAEFWDGWR